MDTPAVAGTLHAKVAAVAPIVGVSVGSVDDKATWRIDFDPKATDAQRKAARAVITAFRVIPPAAPKPKKKRWWIF
jgi:hypothetical protein